MRGFLPNLWASIDSFFSGAEDVAGGHDPLLDVVQHQPDRAACFMKLMMGFGGMWGVLISIPCGAFLSMNWEPCGTCDRPLRHWVLLHCWFQLAQVPIRLVFYVKVHQSQESGEVQECLQALMSSPAWRTSKALSLATYGWGILGTVWLINSSRCAACPGLPYLCTGVVLSGISRIFGTLALFSCRFPNQNNEVQGQERKPEGAPIELISKLPLIRFAPGMSQDEPESSCAICLVQFEQYHLLRNLPCAHKFHKHCIDKWLRRNKICPLCLRDIELPCLGHQHKLKHKVA